MFEYSDSVGVNDLLMNRIGLLRWIKTAPKSLIEASVLIVTSSFGLKCVSCTHLEFLIHVSGPHQFNILF